MQHFFYPKIFKYMTQTLGTGEDITSAGNDSKYEVLEQILGLMTQVTSVNPSALLKQDTILPTAQYLLNVIKLSYG
jgi:hypothetical protein